MVDFMLSEFYLNKKIAKQNQKYIESLIVSDIHYFRYLL